VLVRVPRVLILVVVVLLLLLVLRRPVAAVMMLDAADTCTLATTPSSVSVSSAVRGRRAGSLDGLHARFEERGLGTPARMTHRTRASAPRDPCARGPLAVAPRRRFESRQRTRPSSWRRQ
jgi:hypothetical protein